MLTLKHHHTCGVLFSWYVQVIPHISQNFGYSGFFFLEKQKTNNNKMKERKTKNQKNHQPPALTNPLGRMIEILIPHF